MAPTENKITQPCGLLKTIMEVRVSGGQLRTLPEQSSLSSRNPEEYIIP